MCLRINPGMTVGDVVDIMAEGDHKAAGICLSLILEEEVVNFRLRYNEIATDDDLWFIYSLDELGIYGVDITNLFYSERCFVGHVMCVLEAYRCFLLKPEEIKGSIALREPILTKQILQELSQIYRFTGLLQDSIN